MSRYFIELSYKGTNYHGWQVQENANSVQEELNKALSTLLRTTIETTGAGRTDTGVHALQMYAHFDFDESLNRSVIEKLQHQLNSILPQDIAIKKIFETKPNLHARFDAISRTYEYRIHKIKDPFLNDFSLFLSQPVNISEMNMASKTLFSYQDFSCFSKSNTQVKTNNCKIMQAEWTEPDEHRIIFTIQADRFLRNMVRSIVGTLLDIGSGKTTIQQMKKIIEGKNRSEAGRSVPAHGLWLTKIKYEQF